jgi:hypothetical protein
VGGSIGRRMKTKQSQKKRRRKMGKTIKDVSAKPDDPMFTGATIISAIMRPELSPEEKPKKTKVNTGKKKQKGKGKKTSKLSKKGQQ